MENEELATTNGNTPAVNPVQPEPAETAEAKKEETPEAVVAETSSPEAEPVQTEPVPELSKEMQVTPPEPPKNAGTKKWIAIGAVAAVVICGALAFGMLGGGSPEKELQEALAATAAAGATKTEGIFSLSGAADLVKTFADKAAVTQTGEITITDISESIGDPALFKNMGIAFTSNSNVKEKKLDFHLSGKYKGTGVFGIDFYTDNNALMLAVPALYDGYLTAYADTFVEDYNNSFFGKQQKIVDGDYNMQLFPTEDQAQANLEESAKILKGIMEKTEASRKKISENKKVEKLNAAESNLPEGRLKNFQAPEGDASLYCITIPGTDVTAYMNDLCAYLKEDPSIREALEASAASQYAAGQMSYYYASPNEMVEEVYDNMDTIFEMLNSFFTEDVKIYCYVDSSSIVRESAAVLTSANEYGRQSVDVICSLKGKTNPYDSVSIVLEDGGDNITLTRDIVLNDAKTSYQNHIQAKASLGGEELDFSFAADFDKEAGNALKIDTSITSPGFAIKFLADGTLTVDEQTMTLEFPKAKFEVIDGTAADAISFAAEYTIAVYNGEITEPTGEKIEILKMNDQEMGQFINGIYSRVFGLIMQLSGM